MSLQASICPDCNGATFLREWGRDDRRVTCNRCQGTGREFTRTDAGPLTWDGEPLYSPETVREGLFSTEPFQQMPGQTNWKLVVCACCRQDFYTYPDKPEPYCPTCMEV